MTHHSIFQAFSSVGVWEKHFTSTCFSMWPYHTVWSIAVQSNFLFHCTYNVDFEYLVWNVACWLFFRVGFTLSQATKALRESRGIALLYFWPWYQKGLRGQCHAPAATYPPGKTRYPLYRRLGGPQGRSGQVRKISPHRDSIPRPFSP